ncbi:MAG: hypothetical protein KGL39_01200 [Patescibacteria group bacterium]|nr:hypothetical protein [Patescibacteria group bacterium]
MSPNPMAHRIRRDVVALAVPLAILLCVPTTRRETDTTIPYRQRLFALVTCDDVDKEPPGQRLEDMDARPGDALWLHPCICEEIRLRGYPCKADRPQTYIGPFRGNETRVKMKGQRWTYTIAYDDPIVLEHKPRYGTGYPGGRPG